MACYIESQAYADAAASTSMDVKLNERQIVLHRKFWSHEVIDQLKSMYSLMKTPTSLR